MPRERRDCARLRSSRAAKLHHVAWHSTSLTDERTCATPPRSADPQLRRPARGARAARAALRHDVRAPGAGHRGAALGMAIDIVAPGMRGCPYHLHHAQEEAFVDPRRARHAACRGRDARDQAGDVAFLPPGPTTRTRSSTPRTRRSSTCRSARRPGPRSSSTPTRASTSRPPARRGPARFARMGRLDTDLDYWEGEP